MIEFLCDVPVCPSDYQIYRRNKVLSFLTAFNNSSIIHEESKVCLNVLTASVVFIIFFFFLLYHLFTSH